MSVDKVTLIKQHEVHLYDISDVVDGIHQLRLSLKNKIIIIIIIIDGFLKNTVPSSVPTSKSRGPAPRDVRSFVGCHPKETLHC